MMQSAQISSQGLHKKTSEQHARCSYITSVQLFRGVSMPFG